MTKTLLIADDNESFSRMVASVATRRGWVCSAYRSGIELITSLDEMAGPALLLLDILMPDLDGIETVERIKNSSAKHELRIRFVTGGDHRNAKAAGLIASARAFNVGATLYKPLTIPEIDAVLVEEAGLLRRRDDQSI